jgi:hypothetical protein
MATTRRRLLAGVGTVATAALAGCNALNAARGIESTVVENTVEGVAVADRSQSYTVTGDGRTLAVVVRLENQSENTVESDRVCVDFVFYDDAGDSIGTGSVTVQRTIDPGEIRPVGFGYTEQPDAVDRYTVGVRNC